MGRSDNVVDVPLSGILNIENSTEVARSLSNALSNNEKLIINLSGVAEFDLPGVQLLYSACQAAAGQGKPFKLTGAINPDAVRKLLNAGFIKNACNSGEALMAMLPDFPVSGSPA